MILSACYSILHTMPPRLPIILPKGSSPASICSPITPLLGGYIAEDSSRTYREVLQGRYRIIYRSDAHTVYIVAIHHASRLMDTSDLL
jgi:hypothetical protein